MDICKNIIIKDLINDWDNWVRIIHFSYKNDGILCTSLEMMDQLSEAS